MSAKLYWFSLSHPSLAVRRMLELKQIEFREIDVLPGTQRIHLRLAGFRHGTVPALRLGDGRRVQGSLQIARALEQLTPEPSLFPRDPGLRRDAEEAERWAEAKLQSAPRVLLRWGLVHNLELRRWLAEAAEMPMPAIAARSSTPAARYYAHVIDADEAAAHRVVEALPGMLDNVDELLAGGTLAVDPPNAAALQALSSVRALDAFTDLRGALAGRPSTAAAHQLFPDFPGPIPRFVPPSWLGAIAPRDPL
jgi:glutathione S-transferase